MINKETLKRLILFGIIIAVLILSGIAIFSQPYLAGKEHYGFFEYNDQPVVIDYGTQYVNVTVNDFTLSLDSYADGAIYDTAWLTSEFDTTVRIGDFSGCRVWVNDTEVQPNSETSFRVDRIAKDSYIDIKFSSVNTVSERTVKIRTLNSSFPEYQTYSKSDNGDDICFSIPDYNYIVKMDRAGNVLFYRLGSGASNFTQHNINGKIRYSFMETTGASLAGSSEYKSHKAVILNEQYQVIDIIENTLPVDNGIAAQGLCEDGFDFIDDSHYIIATLFSDYCEPTDSGKYRAAVTRIQEVNCGSIIWCKDIYNPDMSDYIKDTTTTEESASYSEHSDMSEQDTINNTQSEPIFPDMMGLDMLRKSESGNYTFCLFLEANIVCRIDNTGKIADVITAPEGYHFKGFDEISDSKILSLISSDETGATEVMECDFSRPLQTDSGMFLGHSSGNGTIDKTKSGSILISWGNNYSPDVEFTEFASDGKAVTFELITSENAGVVIDSVSYAIKDGVAG